jgi:hypothetical protein
MRVKLFGDEHRKSPPKQRRLGWGTRPVLN